MRIAFVSFEYPPDTALGGIATYVVQIARSLAMCGVEVEVFCGSPDRTETEIGEAGVVVHRLKSDRFSFPTAVVPGFVQRHRKAPFDVIEGPDFLAEARYIHRALPDLPLVVKLHTPYFFAQKFGRFPYTRQDLRNQLRLLWYVVKTRNVRALSTQENPLIREERMQLLQADEVAAPSRAVAEIVMRAWGVAPERISLVPYAYEPVAEMLRIPLDTHTRRISFVGRLEWRKGVQDLAPAIPAVLERHPDVRFRFVGAWSASPITGTHMKDYLCARVPSRFHDRLEFTGRVAPDQIPRHLAETDICVFPSRWESFGFVVLEAMAAGRAVVCTDNGGMAELVDQGRYGLLVPPKSPSQIANRLNHLLTHPEVRRQLGARARREGLARFHPDRVVPLQLRSYDRAIAARGVSMARVG